MFLSVYKHFLYVINHIQMFQIYLIKSVINVRNIQSFLIFTKSMLIRQKAKSMCQQG